MLRAVAAARIPREAAETAVEELLLFAGLSRDDFTIRGPHLSVSHAVHFTGDDATAASPTASQAKPGCAVLVPIQHLSSHRCAHT